MDVNHRFKVHKLNGQGFNKAEQIALAFDSLRKQLELICGWSPRMMDVDANLEVSCFLAKKTMAERLENQVDENRGDTSHIAGSGPSCVAMKEPNR